MLIRCLHLKALVPQHWTPIFRSVLSLNDLLNVDETNINVLNFSNELIFEVTTEAHDLLNA